MLRIHICKPGFTLANTHLDGDGYAELGSRFKAANVKNMLWWLCRETQRVAEKLPDRPLGIGDSLLGLAAHHRTDGFDRPSFQR